MKGDFSRRTFDPDNHYSAVLQEQGRMLSDADLEEEHRILAHRIETEAADVIGGCGGPIGAAGFEITPSGTEFQIGAGRYYVDGILVENEADVDFSAQLDHPGAAWPPEGGTGRYLAVLDVWRRLVTALDDPSIREVALGGPTTSAREQTIWQVRAASVADDATCLDPLPDMGGTTGQMAAQADPEIVPDEPCEVPPSAGFKGLENQFYRVEVHDSGDAYDMTAAPDLFEITAFPTGTTNQVEVTAAGDLAAGQAVEVFAQATPLESTFAHVTDVSGNTITLSSDLAGFSVDDDPFMRRVGASFVWSRDNGHVVTTIERIDGNEITVRDLGRDEVLGFAPGQWVEISDDLNDLEMQPGQLLRVEATDMARRVITVATPAQQLDPAAPDGSGVNPDLHPKLRRWDGAGAIRANNADPADDWIHLEDGVQVRFTDGRYRTDDYWHFPARTAVIDPTLGNIEWPRDSADNPALLPPHGIEHHYCPLALVDVEAIDDETLGVGDIIDCRDLFPPVTQLTNLLYVGGDGQEGLPDPADPGSRSVDLGAPLQVRVANGAFPVEGATVQFTIDAVSNGRLEGTMSKTADITTDADGIATCQWQLDGSTPDQFCEARLLDVASNPLDHQAVNFHASLSTADRVSYDPTDCPDLAGVQTVQEALDALCQREGGGGGRCCCIVIGPGGDFDDIQTAIEAMRERDERDICLCLIPGDHEFSTGVLLTAEDAEQPWNLSIAGCGPGTRLDLAEGLIVVGLNSFALHDLEITMGNGVSIEARQCRSVDVDRCRISGLPRRTGLVRILHASRIYVGNSTLESFSQEVLEEAINFLDAIPELQDIYTLFVWREFERAARGAAIQLSSRDPGDRQALADELRARLDASQGFISSGEAAAYQRLAETLALEEADPLAILDHLIAIRWAVVQLNPGVALEVGALFRDEDGGLSAAGTRDGMATIENNDIAGVVSFYGTPPNRDIDAGRLRALRDRLREGGLGWRGLDLDVHAHGNRLTRFAISDQFFRLILRSAETDEGIFDELLASFQCSDNVIQGATSVLAAYHLSLESNQFSLDAVRGVDPGAQMAVRVADVIGDTAVYIGNHGASRGFGVTFISRLFDATRASAEAANLELAIA